MTKALTVWLFGFLRWLTARAATDQETCSQHVVQTDYSELISSNSDPTVAPLVAKAFGQHGLGILAVRGIPEALAQARRELLYMSRSVALLSPETLAKYERPDLDFVVGWSRGREKFRGKVDTAKGSFYANALYADPAQGDPMLEAQYPSSTAEPAWPDADIGANLSGCFRDVARAMYTISYHVLRHADSVVEAALSQRRRRLRTFWAHKVRRRKRRLPLYEVTHNRSRLHVGRLLHYYPSVRQQNWCGWHNDNSILTVLAPPLYFDDDTGAEASAPPGAGLVVYAAPNKTVRVELPDDDRFLLFQLGEASQVLSGGALVATPHAVLPGASEGRNVSRDTFAVFVEPNWNEPLSPPPGSGLKDVYADEHASDVIPPLRDRLRKVPVDFAQFLADSVREYYD